MSLKKLLVLFKNNFKQYVNSPEYADHLIFVSTLRILFSSDNSTGSLAVANLRLLRRRLFRGLRGLRGLRVLLRGRRTER